MTGPSNHAGWPWPEPRLTYANATLPEAMIAAGATLDRPALLRRGLDLLEWLLGRETHDGHLSVTPVGGSGSRRPESRGSTNSRLRLRRWPMRVPARYDVDGDQLWSDGITAAAELVSR